MANNYCFTSITILGKDGKPAKVGKLGTLLLPLLFRGESPWFDEDKMQGVFDSSPCLSTLVEDLEDKLVYEEEDDIETVGSLLRALNEEYRACVSDAMLELADDLFGHDSDDCDLSAADILQVLALEEGADIDRVSEETGWYCDRMFLGEFGGYGRFISPQVTVSAGSRGPDNLGPRLSDAIKAKDYREVASLVLNDLIQPLTDSMPAEARAEVLKHLAIIVKGNAEAPQGHRMVIEIDGTSLSIAHDVTGLDVSIIDNDPEGVDDAAGRAERDAALRAEAAALPYKL